MTSLRFLLATVNFQAAHHSLLHCADMMTLLVRPTLVSVLECDLKIESETPVVCSLTTCSKMLEGGQLSEAEHGLLHLSSPDNGSDGKY